MGIRLRRLTEETAHRGLVRRVDSAMGENRGRRRSGSTSLHGVQSGSRPVSPTSRSRTDAEAGTGTSGPKMPICRPCSAMPTVAA
jgi:hypothetical protein